MADDLPQEKTQARRRELVRLIRDAQFRDWVVREMPGAPYDRRRGASLVFMSDGIMRRVRQYPANWSDLSDLDLYVLSQGR